VKRRIGILIFAFTVGLGCWNLNQGYPVHAQEALVMVANKANAAAAGMTVAAARKLLLGQTTDWRGGAKVVVVLAPPGSSDRAAVLKKVCGMTESAYTRYEMQAVFTGATAAKVAESASDSAIREIVKTNSGAVGFLHKSAVDPSVQTVLELQ
jgi:ABC-type phosphate transport system substrate-binding protein